MVTNAVEKSEIGKVVEERAGVRNYGLNRVLREGLTKEVNFIRDGRR